MSETTPSIKRLDSSQIVRDYRKERLAHIEDLCLYAYEDASGYIYIFGEVIAQELWTNIYFPCTLYEQEDDIILTQENSSYGSGLVTRVIAPEAFFNRFPFSFCFLKPKTPVSRIVIAPISF